MASPTNDMADQTSSPDDPSAVLLSRGDRVGMIGSVLCAVHCALLPLVLAVVPTLGLGAFALVDIDQAFTVFATLLGVTTLSFGFRRHRAFHAWVFLIPGLALVWLASFSPLHDHSVWHVLMMVAGGASMATAHFVNLRLTHLFDPRHGRLASR